MIKRCTNTLLFFASLAACNIQVPTEPPTLGDAAEQPQDSGRQQRDTGRRDLGHAHDAGSPPDRGFFPPRDTGAGGDITIIRPSDDGGSVTPDDTGRRRCGNPFECPPGFFCSNEGFCEPNPDQQDAGEPPPPHDDHGNSMDRATQMMPNQAVQGVLERGGDEDFFQVMILQPGWYRIYTTGGTDTFCHLLPVDGDQIAQNDDSGQHFNCLIEHELRPGLYGVRVRHFAHDGTGAYTLHIDGPVPAPPVCGNGRVEEPEQCDDGNRDAGDGCDEDCQREAPPPQDDHSNTGAQATPIALNQRLNGHLETPGDVDYFVLTVDREMRVIAGTLGSTDTRCQAELVQGDVIDVDADSGPGSNCRLTFTARPGRPIYLRIEGERLAVRGEYTVFVALE